MTKVRARVVTRWYRGTITDPETGTAHETDHYNGVRCPQVGVDYPLRCLSDVTSQPSAAIPPQPNALVVEVECAPEVLAQMDADGVPILWAEEVEDASGGS